MNVFEIYEGSDGERTKDLYAQLERLGPIGLIALNLFRANKCSTRAKGYRRFKGAAYDRKQWSIDNLCRVLEQHSVELGFTWGWREDPAQEFHKQVLYVDLPTGCHVSFHTAFRGHGPDYTKPWDGIVGVSGQRICTWVQSLISPPESCPLTARSEAVPPNPDSAHSKLPAAVAPAAAVPDWAQDLFPREVFR